MPRGRRRTAVLGALVAAGLLALVQAQAAITPSRDAAAVSRALSDSAQSGSVGAASFTVIAPDASGVRPAAVSNDSDLAGFPTSGSTFAVLSSGDATLADRPDLGSASVSNGGSEGGHGPSFFDVVQLRLTLKVPKGTNCLQFQFKFFSEEYPIYVGSTYNDAFLAELDVSDFTADQTTKIVAPHNFAVGPRADGNGDDIVSVNTAGFSADNAVGTIYNGGTPPVIAGAPVAPGTHTLFLTVLDQGDSRLDSTALIDGLRFAERPPASCRTIFEPRRLTVRKTGSGRGRVTSKPAGIACGPTCSADFDRGTKVTLSAHAGKGSAFAGWGRACSGTGACRLTMSANRRVTAAFSGPAATPPTGTAKGTVLVNGRRFESGPVPFGSRVDVTRGQLRLKTSVGKVLTYGDREHAAKYVLRRSSERVRKRKRVRRRTVVELRLIGGDYGVCGSRQAASEDKRRKRKVRGLWGKGKGRFRTRGRYSAATVRGTKWLTADRCDGTLTAVRSGTVSVKDFTRRRTVTVRAGRSYLAPAP